MISTGSNATQVQIARLRTISLNDQESPVARIQAARKLLQDHGPSQRSLPIIRRVIKLFVSHSDPDIAERAMKLRARLAKILELKSVTLPKDLEDEPIEISEDSTDIEALALESKPRRPLTEREQYLKELEERIPKVVKQPDGYEPDFLNVNEAIQRVVLKYTAPPPYTDLENQGLLETFLGDSTPLNAHSASQISLHLAQEFKARGGNYSKTFTSIFPPVIIAVQTALCQYVNSRSIAVPPANCLSITDDLGFCS